MAFLEWTEETKIGVGRLDDGHKKLFDIMNRLHDSVLAGNVRDILNDTLDELDDLADTQFNSEMYLLEQTGYHNTCSHRAIHKVAIKMFANIRRDESRVDNRLLAMEMLRVTKGWLFLHIQQEDRKYGKFLNNMGIY